MLHHLKLTNFRGHSKTEFEFDLGVTSIVGRSGAGKTSIIEAIGFLFDYYQGQQSDYIAYGKESATVQAEFDPDITLTRQIGRGASFTIRNPSKTLANNYTQAIKFMESYGNFEHVYLPQDSLTVPFKLNLTLRKQYFDSLLGLNNYDILYQNLTEPVKSIKLKLQSLEKDLENLQAFDDAVGAVGKLLFQVQVARQTVEELEDTINSLKIDQQKLHDAKYEQATLNGQLNLPQKCPYCGKTLIDNYDAIAHRYHNLQGQIHILESDILIKKKYKDEYDLAKSKMHDLTIKIDTINNMIPGRWLSKYKTTEALIISLNALFKRIEKIRTSTKTISQAIAEYIIAAVSEDATVYLSQVIDYVTPVQVIWQPDYDVRVRLGNNILNYNQLSGGQKSLTALAIRLAIFKAVGTGRLFILDEPTANLDNKSKDLLVDMLHTANVADQMIIVTHDTSIVRMVNHVIYV